MLQRLLISLFITLGIFTQISNTQAQSYKELISKKDAAYLKSIKRLNTTDFPGVGRFSLPSSVDNSQHKFFRPIFSQYGWSCGQASSIGYIFAYEMNRVRDLDGTLEENMYPPDFTWNMLNEGSYDVGVAIFDSWEVAIKAGNPNAIDYGGFAIDEYTWMSGYSKYYNAMHNRIQDFFAIDLTTEDGLTLLKNWIHNHLAGEETGGVANILIASSGTWEEDIPEDSPEAGQRIIVSWGQHVGHQVTIVGYNDEIKFDVNGDGEYTNDVDINEDGIVDIKDWEIGAFKVANSWGDYFGNGGFIYMMYRLGAMEGWDGGIWGHAAYIIKVNENTEPDLTASITLTHPSRNKIKISAGISSNPESTYPEHIIDYPIFNYSGGDLYMQGGSSSSDKTIQIGVDFSPLLAYLDEGQEAKFFLLVDEKDPEDKYEGKIVRFKLIDHNDGDTEYTSASINSPLVNNSQTKLSINLSPVFDKLVIETEEIDPIIPNEAYAFQIEASGGSEPLVWEFMKTYTQSNSIEDFPTIDEEKLSYSSLNYEYYAEKELEFDFPFYNTTINKVYLSPNGIITFDDIIYRWPYTTNPQLLVENTKCIFPLYRDGMTKGSQTDFGIFYEGNEDYALFRWKVKDYYGEDTNDVNFAAKLYSDGSIEYYYGDINLTDDLGWYSGISWGDGTSFNNDAVISSNSIENGKTITYTPNKSTDGISLSQDGLLTADFEEVPAVVNIGVIVTDANLVEQTQNYYFITDGLEITNALEGSETNTIGFGDTCLLNTFLHNKSNEDLNNISIVLTTENQYISIINSSVSIDQLAFGETMEVENNISFKVDANIPDKSRVEFSLTLSSNEIDLTKELIYISEAPVISVTEVSTTDYNNGFLEPGETGRIKVPVLNNGAALSDVKAVLTNTSGGLTVVSDELVYNTIESGEEKSRYFTVSIPENFTSGNLEDFNFNLVGKDGQFTFNFDFSLMIGKKPILVLDLAPMHISGPALTSILDDNNVVYDYSDSWINEVTDYQSIFLFLGQYNTYYSLSDEEGEILANHLNDGGNLYMEGYKTWTTGSSTAVHSMFNVNKYSSSYYYLENIIGAEGEFTQNYNFEFSLTDDYSNRNKTYFHAKENATEILFNASDDKCIMVMNNSGTYKTIASTVLLGGFADHIGYYNLDHLVNSFLIYFDLIDGLITTTDDINSLETTVSLYPNPFKDQTIISFDIKENSNVSVEIFNFNGQIVKSISHNQSLNKGKYEFTWDRTNETGSIAKAGMYFYRVTVNDKMQTGKLVVTE